jgi:hypothetical protein
MPRQPVEEIITFTHVFGPHTKIWLPEKAAVSFSESGGAITR